MHPSQGSVEAIHLFYSELLRRRFKINFRLQKNSLVDKEATPYCLADNCNISRLSSPVFPTFTEVNSFGQRVKNNDTNLRKLGLLSLHASRTVHVVVCTTDLNFRYCLYTVLNTQYM